MTTLTQLPFDQLAALRSEDVQLYLASQGWRATTHLPPPKVTSTAILLFRTPKRCSPRVENWPTTPSGWATSCKCWRPSNSEASGR